MKRRDRSAPTTIVIVGAGQAGVRAAFALREHGFGGRVILIGNEGQPPYQRPPLSKSFLAGHLSVERLFLHAAQAFATHAIELELHTDVEAIDRASAQLRLTGGGRLGYDKLLLATGCRPRELACHGARSPGVHYLRTLQDAMRLRENLTRGRRVAIVGGGYIGLEVAAVAALQGAVVTVVEAERVLLPRVTTPAVGEFFAAAHRRHGVRVICGARATAFLGDERLGDVETDAGRIRADLAIVGVGALPNDELARAAGLRCDDGIVVDAHCRTSDPAIFAAGDCASAIDALSGRRVRHESVQNAIDQATVAARNLAGDAARNAAVPWFWSNQYEYKLQIAGTFVDHDEVVERGSQAEGSFALLYRRHGALIGVDAVNMPREYMAARKELAAALAARGEGRPARAAVVQPQAA